MRITPRTTVPAFLLAATVCMYGCGSGSGAPQSAVANVQIKERDFKISGPETFPSGHLDLSVDNLGPDDHELIIARASGQLPRRADGLTVDEKAIEKQTVGTLEPGIGSRGVAVNLRPGRYVMFCNMQGHYLGGMHQAFQVR